MEAARRGSDHHVIHIHLRAQPAPADGKDHKHGQPPLRPAPGSGPLGDDPPTTSLVGRAVRWLRGTPVVVGSVPAHERKGGVPSWLSWKRHAVPVVCAAITEVGAYVLANDEDKAGPLLFGAGTGLACGYMGQHAATRLADGCAWLHERHRLRAGSVPPQQQLTRILELANARPLTRQGLRSAVGRIQALHELDPQQIGPAAVVDAIAQLARGALSLGPETPVHLNQLADALVAWQARAGLDGATMVHAFTRLAEELCSRPRLLTDHSKCLSLVLLIGQLVDWADGAPGRLPEAQRVACVKRLGTMGGMAEPHAAFLREHAWQALIQDLPAEPAPQIERIIARLALEWSDPGWLLDYGITHIHSRHDPSRGAPAYQAYARALVGLLGAVGRDFDEWQVASWIVNAMWPASVRGTEGVAAQLLGVLPEVVDTFGWRLSVDHVVGLIGAMTGSHFFGTEPTPQEAARHTLALVRPTMSLTLRRELLEMVARRWGLDSPLVMQPAMAPAALLAVLRDIPLERLAPEIGLAIDYLGQGQNPLAAARHCLAAIDILAQRSAAPGFPRLDGGLVGPLDIQNLIARIASAPPDESNCDRGEVIARLPQLCQRTTSADVVKQAVGAIQSLPELWLDLATSSSPRKYPSETLGLVLQACTSPTLFIAESDESAQSQEDARPLQASDFLPPDPTQPAQLAPTRIAASATLEFPWLTPAFIAEMTAPLTGQRESKHG